MRVNVNTSVQFCFARELRNYQRFRKAATTRHRNDMRCGGWELSGKPVRRAYTIGNCMSVGERWTGVAMVRVRTIPVGHELTDAS
jgi:hypothetical protein